MVAGRSSTEVGSDRAVGVSNYREDAGESLVDLYSIEHKTKTTFQLQDMIRTSWLDAYFVYSSILGTHTFFMILLPALFFFGYDEMGRGYVIRFISLVSGR